MKYYSTNNPQQYFDLETAVRQGLPEDNGLFMPQVVPVLGKEFYKQLVSGMSLSQVGYEVLHQYVKEAVPEKTMRNICDEAFSFPAPLVKITDSIHALELYHGPTMAFKDFGARFMARLLAYFNSQSESRTTILVATSGDTGSAVADGFYGVDQVNVVILYPKGKVSDLQERQMTTLGKNIQAIAIDGSFDDCQKLAKEAFLDKPLTQNLGLTSANSINIARLLPQMIYYFYAYGQICEKDRPLIFSVPSGNYGNLTAGVLAKKMGLPINHFIAATNANDIIPQYISSGNFTPRPSVGTISNAMDVGNPSNYFRLMDIFGDSWERFRDEISGFSLTDDQTRQTIHQVYKAYNYVLDPHGAIGYEALKNYLINYDAAGIFLETAHPIKFREEVELQTNTPIKTPASLMDTLRGQKKSIQSNAIYQDFRDLLQGIID